MTEFQSRVFTAVVSLTRKKGRAALSTCAVVILSTIVQPLLKGR